MMRSALFRHGRQRLVLGMLASLGAVACSDDARPEGSDLGVARPDGGEISDAGFDAGFDGGSDQGHDGGEADAGAPDLGFDAGAGYAQLPPPPGPSPLLREAEHPEAGARAEVRRAGEGGPAFLAQAAGEAALWVRMSGVAASYALSSPVGARQLCLRMVLDPEVTNAKIRVLGREFETTSSEWAWVCQTVHIGLTETVLELYRWGGRAYVDRMWLGGLDDVPPSDVGGEETPTCGQFGCQAHESCDTCSECCAPACGDGYCAADETCGSCSADCGACGERYTGRCTDPADVQRLPPGQWCQVPGATARSIEKRAEDYEDFAEGASASYESYQRVSGFRSLVRAWGGATLDTSRRRLMLAGGGHNDYGGNEVLAFDLDRLAWQRLTDPTPFPNRHPEVQNPDGSPISRHTYGGLAYLAGTDRFFVLGGAPDHGPGGCGTAGAHVLDLMARDAAPYAPSMWTRLLSEGEPATGCEDKAVYDPIRGQLLFHSRNALHLFDEAETRWRSVGSSVERSQALSPVLVRGRFVFEVGRDLGGVQVFDLEAEDLAPRVAATSGAGAPEGVANPGLTYLPAQDRVLAHIGGATVYRLNPDTFAWEEVAPPTTARASPTVVTASGGTYGRFAYVPDADVAIYVGDVDRPVYLYRPPAP